MSSTATSMTSGLAGGRSPSRSTRAYSHPPCSAVERQSVRQMSRPYFTRCWQSKGTCSALPRLDHERWDLASSGRHVREPGAAQPREKSGNAAPEDIRREVHEHVAHHDRVRHIDGRKHL